MSNSVTSDVGSDSAYETSDLGTPRQGRNHITEISREILSSGDGQVGAFDNDVILGEFVLDQPEESHRSMIRGDIYRGSSSKEFHSRDRVESSEQGHEKLSVHARKSSGGSVGSDASSIRCSELSLPGMSSSIVDGSTDFLADADTPNALQEMQYVNDAHIVFPLDQRNKLNRVLATMQRRLVTAKTDMEDLITRLNQEMTVKEYLTTKICLQNEKQCWTHVKAARKKLLHEYGALRRRLNECSVSLLAEDEDKFIITPSVLDALDLLVTSDNRIGLLLTEAQLLAQDDELAVGGMDKTRNSESSRNSITINGDESMVADTLIDNARLRKQVNSVIRSAIKKCGEARKG